jgi:hypothetical protein
MKSYEETILKGTSITTTDSPAFSKAELDRNGVLSANNLFTLDGALAIIFAVAFLALAPQLLAFYGIGVSTGSVLITHILATFMLAAGITQLGARAAADSAAGRSITLGYLATNVVGAIIVATAVASGAANMFGLGFVGLFLILGSWRAYLLVRAYRPGLVRSL